MTRKKREYPLSVICPTIGQGNPLTAIAIARLAGRDLVSLHLVSGGVLSPLQIAHRVMSRIGRASEIYTERSERLRGGITGIVTGMIVLAQWLVNERWALGGLPLAYGGIFVQEHLLRAIPKEVLERLFPGGAFFYIPDVYPKKSAVEILKQLNGVVTPLVWNRSAWRELSDQGLSPALVAPVLPGGFLREGDLKRIGEGKQNNPPLKIVIKTSGSGISRELMSWLDENIIKKRPPGQTVEYWWPQKVVIYSDDYPEGKEEELSDLTEYGERFYASLLDADQGIFYPSEMVQVVAWLKAHGWRGKFFALPPRGAHEERNLKWAGARGVVDEVYNKGEFTPIEESSFSLKDLEKELGKTPIEELVESLVEFRRNLFSQERVGISSEALKGLPSILLPFTPQELVIDVAYKLQGVRDYSDFFGVHYRRKKREGFWEDLAEVFNRLKEHQKKLPPGFYVSFHLENLSLFSEEELEEKLRWLEEKATEIGIDILLENTTARVDRDLSKEFYSLIAFWNKYAALMEQLPHLGFCLDIAHLGLAEPEIFLILAKYYQAKEAGLPYPTMLLNDEERQLFQGFQSILARTKVIHWSRAQGEKISAKRSLFKVFQRLAALFSKEKLREKFHNLYSLLENIILAHYPVAPDSDLFVIIFRIFKDLGWEGRIVIESPAILEILRSGQRPFNYLDRLRFSTSRQAEVDLDYLSHGEIPIFDLKDLSTFLEPEYSFLPPGIFPILKKAFPLILSIYDRERRRVNRGLYLRHVLKTTLVAYQLIKTLNLDGIDKERMVLSVLFHDAFEVNPRYDELKLENSLRQIFSEKKETWWDSVCADVRFLTPPPKDPNLSFFERKKQDFERFIPKDEEGRDKPFACWSDDEKLRFLTKVADVYANLYETVADLKNGLDGSKVMKPLELRAKVFQERFKRIKEVLPQWSLSPSLEDLIKQLETFI